ncbi:MULTISPECIES: hypothetical protein [unclassified Pseudomonas]|uniref:hypothetical protein n=1 Tax=unclassified Pseudomonas TaxID=196821 RepID=UPI001FD40327|nr:MULTISPECIES: hypothetical protein [unclassified Pseudomonas]
MTKKIKYSIGASSDPIKLAEAVERYVSQGGVINVIAEGESRETEASRQTREADPEAELCTKVDLLKGLVAKGAGVAALQYSLRMNQKDIKRLASENGLKIRYCQPVRRSRASRQREPVTLDDAIAGHAMHYSALGYTVPEIAQLLGVGVRDIWDIGKAYRFEFRTTSQGGTAEKAAGGETDLPD